MAMSGLEYRTKANLAHVVTSLTGLVSLLPKSHFFVIDGEFQVFNVAETGEYLVRVRRPRTKAR